MTTHSLTPHGPPRGTRSSSASSRQNKKGGSRSTMFLLIEFVLFVSVAKKMMSLVSGRTDADLTASSSTSPSFSLRAKKKRKQLYRTDISAPMDMPPHPVGPLVNVRSDTRMSHDKCLNDTALGRLSTWFSQTSSSSSSSSFLRHSFQIVTSEPEEKESDHQIIKRRLRSRIVK